MEQFKNEILLVGEGVVKNVDIKTVLATVYQLTVVAEIGVSSNILSEKKFDLIIFCSEKNAEWILNAISFINCSALNKYSPLFLISFEHQNSLDARFYQWFNAILHVPFKISELFQKIEQCMANNYEITDIQYNKIEKIANEKPLELFMPKIEKGILIYDSQNNLLYSNNISEKIIEIETTEIQQLSTLFKIFDTQTANYMKRKIIETEDIDFSEYTTTSFINVQQEKLTLFIHFFRITLYGQKYLLFNLINFTEIKQTGKQIHDQLNDIENKNETLQRINQQMQNSAQILRKAMTNLKESNEYHNIIFNATTDAILICNKSGLLIKANKEAEILFKFTDLPPQRNEIFSFFEKPTEGKEFLENLIQQEVYSAQTNIIDSKGQIFIADIKGRKITTKNEIHLLFCFIDLSNQKATQRALEKNERLFRLLAENSTDGVCLVLNNVITYISPAYERFAGKDVFNLVNQNMAVYFEKMLWEDAQKNKQIIENAYINHSEQVTYTYSLVSNKDIWLEDSMQIVYNERFVPTKQIINTRNITERKLAIEKFVQKQSELQQLVENIPIGMYRTHPKGNILMVNPALTQMLGFENEEELLSRNLETYQNENKFNREEFKMEIEEKGKIIEYFTEWTKKDGTKIPVLEYASCVYDKYQNLMYYEGTAIDVSHSIQQQNKLNRVVNELNAIIDNTAIGIAFVVNNVFQRINSRFADLCGFQQKELQGKNILLLRNTILDFHNIVKDCISETNQQKTFMAETVVHLPSQKNIWCKLMVKNMNPNNANEGAIWLLEDISERKEIEKLEDENREKLEFLTLSASKLISLENEQKMYEYLAKSIKIIVPESIIMLFTINNQNDTAHLIETRGFTVKQKKVLGKILDTVYPQRYFQLKRTLYKKYLSEKLFIYSELHELLYDFFSEETVVTLLDVLRFKNSYSIGISRDGEPFAGIIFLTDNNSVIQNSSFIETIVYQASIAISQKQLEKEVLEAKEKAEKANNAKSSFLANISHEIRTPLNSVLGFTEILSQQINNPVYLNYLNTIKASGINLLNLFNDILDLATIETGRWKLSKENVLLKELISEISDVFQANIRSKNLNFSINIEENCPKAIVFDAIRLKQILLNLVGNAIKFTEKGFVKIDILMQEIPEKNILQIKISDSGIGIKDSDLSAIFEAFTQQDEQDNRKYSGTGLGLTITKRLVEALNGTIEVESIVNQGSIFTVSFYNVEPAVINNPHQNDKLQLTHNQTLSGKLILVADDVEANQMLLCTYLEDLKGSVIFANNGQDAVEMALKHQPNIIFMDLKMPIMDGFQAVELLRANEKTEKTIIFATSAALHIDSELKTMGFNGFMRKPFTFKELKKVLAIEEEIKKNSLLTQISEEDYFYIKNTDCITNLYAELVKIFQPRVEELLKAPNFMDIEIFCAQLLELNKKCGAQIINEYAERLMRALKNFNIDDILSALLDFSTILQRLKKFVL